MKARWIRAECRKAASPVDKLVNGQGARSRQRRSDDPTRRCTHGQRQQLNFDRTTEEAFTFYKEVFGTEFEGVVRFGDMPMEGAPPVSEEDSQLIMNIALPILGGHLLMGTDATESMGMTLVSGNNFSISLHPDTREEADALFAALAEGGSVDFAMHDAEWGAYFGAITNRFGIQWMFNVENAG